VPHPGLDIEAREGEPFRSVFEGEVVYASWLRGYGLTAIVDHGSGVMSIYAHASVLVVEEGSRVVTGERLGLVGETGSLAGPFLYFELRRDGKPIDPVPWLRPR
jgi:septal ring factor EnvC (AmiA/AmiB activator)